MEHYKGKDREIIGDKIDYSPTSTEAPPLNHKANGLRWQNIYVPLQLCVPRRKLD